MFLSIDVTTVNKSTINEKMEEYSHNNKENMEEIVTKNLSEEEKGKTFFIKLGQFGLTVECSFMN